MHDSRRRLAPRSLEDLLEGLPGGAAVALRADFNVPLTKGGQVADPARVERTVPTIRELVRAGAKVVILSHLGRPRGREDPALTLEPVSRCLRGLLSVPVGFSPRTAGPEVAEAVAAMTEGSVLLLENTRFLPGETGNAPTLAASWAGWANHFVLDAFGTAHRAHASTDGLPRAVREAGGDGGAGAAGGAGTGHGRCPGGPGPAFRRPAWGCQDCGEDRSHRGVAPAGGTPCWWVEPWPTRFSVQWEWRPACPWSIRRGPGPPYGFSQPPAPAWFFRWTVSPHPEIAEGTGTRVVDRAEIAPGEAVGDIGPVTVQLFAEYLERAATVVWNGPMGVFEITGFAAGTVRVARAAAAAADRGAMVMVGGGDSAAAVRTADVAPRIGHMSTGGGALLDLLAGKELPGLAALSSRRV